MGLPLARIVIDGVEIPASNLMMGSIDHDIDEGTVTLTFLGVRLLETVYAHMEEEING